MNISFPDNTEEIIDSIRNAIGRTVNFIYQAGETPCPVCDLDPVNNTSTDSFCEVCSGLYWIPVFSGYETTAHITWKPADRMAWVTAGVLYDGDCLIQIKATEEAESLIKTKGIVIVDGKEMYVETKFPRGVPQINRILYGLKERTKDNE